MPSITSLAIKYKSDKYGSHYYTEIYEKYMSKMKNKNINILEIGIGGYTHEKGGYLDTSVGGESLKIWRDYFKKGKIAGLDIVEKKINLGKRVKIFQGSQSDSEVLSKIIKKFKKFDFIVDDGSHRYEDVKFSFEYLYKYLNNGGYYFIEDTQSSFIREFGGDGANLDKKNTVINYFKKIIDKINNQEIENPYYKIDDIALNTTEIHFYHNMIVIKKKKNLEKSNILINNRRLVGGKNFYKTRIFIKNTKYFLLNIKAKINIFISYIRF